MKEMNEDTEKHRGSGRMIKRSTFIESDNSKQPKRDVEVSIISRKRGTLRLQDHTCSITISSTASPSLVYLPPRLGDASLNPAVSCQGGYVNTQGYLPPRLGDASLILAVGARLPEGGRLC